MQVALLDTQCLQSVQSGIFGGLEDLFVLRRKIKIPALGLPEILIVAFEGLLEALVDIRRCVGDGLPLLHRLFHLLCHIEEVLLHVLRQLPDVVHHHPQPHNLALPLLPLGLPLEQLGIVLLELFGVGGCTISNVSRPLSILSDL